MGKWRLDAVADPMVIFAGEVGGIAIAM